MRRAVAISAVLALLLLVGACPTDPPSLPVPGAAVTVYPASLAFEAVVAGGAAAPGVITVATPRPATVAAPVITIRYGSGSGWLAVTVQGVSAPYTLTVTASPGSLPAGAYQAHIGIACAGGSPAYQEVPVTLSVAPAALPSLSAASARSQFAAAGQPVADPPAVLAVDDAGRPLPGVVVTFAVVAGGGTVTGEVATTGSDGVARVGSWTLGPGGAQRVEASAPGLDGSPVTFDAAIAGETYGVTIRFLSTPPDDLRLAFEAARLRIERVVRGDLPDVLVRMTAAQGASCGGIPALNEVVDDLLLYVAIVPIDGQGGTLARAGPCVIRDAGGLPVLGFMEVDEADLSILQSHGFTASVVAHELLHVLGFGTLWAMATPSLISGAGTADPLFTGRGAIDAFLQVNGGSSYAGAPVPLEGTGSAGTRDAHWRESVFRSELMTGWLSSFTQPLSRTTVASLGDLGYQVDLDAAEPFDIRTAAVSAARPAATADVHDDAAPGPAYAVDAAGNLRPLR